MRLVDQAAVLVTVHPRDLERRYGARVFSEELRLSAAGLIEMADAAAVVGRLPCQRGLLQCEGERLPLRGGHYSGDSWRHRNALSDLVQPVSLRPALRQLFRNIASTSRKHLTRDRVG